LNIVDSDFYGNTDMTDRREFLTGTGALALAATIPAIADDRPSLPTRPIPGSDEQIAIVGLGNSNAFRQGDIATSEKLLDIFLWHGGTYIDVSGSSRDTVGRIIHSRGAQDSTILGNYLEANDSAGLRSEIAGLQEVQGAGPLDLALSADPDGLIRRTDEFRALKAEGLVRHIGVARHNERYYPAMMKLMNDGVVDFIQVNYSMLEPEAAETILPLAQDKGVAVLINRPFINGEYFSRVSGQALPEWAAEFDCDSWAQFSLKYILAHPAVNCVLTETANPKHAVDNLGAGYGRLPDEATRQRMRQLIVDLA
jgi:aryl-alcohol dehydrogenase-like predicted oxidoreductase